MKGQANTRDLRIGKGALHEVLYEDARTQTLSATRKGQEVFK
jgi:hypothetical protein